MATRVDDMDYARRHVSGHLVPLDEAPPEIAATIERALARRPEDRHASMDAFADALRGAYDAVVSTDETRFVESKRSWASPTSSRRPLPNGNRLPSSRRRQARPCPTPRTHDDTPIAP